MQYDFFLPVPSEAHGRLLTGSVTPEELAEARAVMHEMYGRPIQGEGEAVAAFWLLLEFQALNWPRGSLEQALWEWAASCAPVIVNIDPIKTKPDGETSGSDGSV